MFSTTTGFVLVALWIFLTAKLTLANREMTDQSPIIVLQLLVIFQLLFHLLLMKLAGITKRIGHLLLLLVFTILIMLPNSVLGLETDPDADNELLQALILMISLTAIQIFYRPVYAVLNHSTWDRIKRTRELRGMMGKRHEAYLAKKKK